tara:strand:+ start:19887 stop:21131 length:1245 start_codon:yes stop_codon:yes gene_type:complete
MDKVPIWHRADLDDSFPLDANGKKLHSFHNGIRKDKLLLRWDIAHGDPHINLGITNVHYDFVYEAAIPKGKKYYYPILAYNNVPEEEQEEFYHIDPINLKHIRKGRAKILIVNTMEGWDHDSFFKNIIDYFKKKYTLVYEHFVILSGNMELTKYGTPIVYYNWWERHAIFNNIPKLYQDGWDNLRNLNRKHNFICLSRRPHPHRIAISSLLYPYRDKGILTIAKEVDNGSTSVWKKSLHHLSSLYPEFWKQPTTAELIKNVPLVYEDGLNAADTNPTFDNAPQKFYDSYLHVVLETFGSGPQTFFSEKIFKPIMYFQPFVLVGAYKDLSRFKELGYKTFNGLIDEGYDDIEDNEQRLIAVSREIIRITEMSKADIGEWYKDCYDILIHNFWHHIYRMNTMHIGLRNDLLEKLYA